MLAAVRQLLRTRNCSWQSNPEQQFDLSRKVMCVQYEKTTAEVKNTNDIIIYSRSRRSKSMLL